jgi:hypothetical protein
MQKAALSITIFLTIAMSALNAHADLDTFLYGLNSQAGTDLNGFGVTLSAQFGIPVPEVHAIINRVEFPADAFMCLQLSLMTGQPIDLIINTYQRQKRNGWGIIAKELGIKPGSNEFHALKNGDFTFVGVPRGKPDNGHGTGKGKGKDKGKGHNK